MKSTQYFILTGSVLVLIALELHPLSSLGQSSQREQEDAWAKVVRLAESLIGEGGAIDVDGAENKVDALVDLHAQFCRDILGKPVPSQRVLLVKQGFRLFLKTAQDRYSGDKKQAALRLLRDLGANRGVFVELLSSDNPAEAVEQQLLAYLERNQSLSYTDPVPIGGQLKVPVTDTPLRIAVDNVRLVADQGTSGHYNRAIDAGEIITLNIPLKNFADHPFRSTSAILETSDGCVRANVSKVVYTERSVLSGETITFAPGMTITPRQNVTFTISPSCPDSHQVPFNLHVGDSDYGEFNIPFSVLVYHVGPLDFGGVKIDDDRFGDSDGNANGVMEPHETIEYVLPLRNVGVVEVTNIIATLFCNEPNVHFKSGYDENRYKVVPPGGERPIPASFVFTLEAGDTEFQQNIFLRLLTKANARGFNYSWLRTQAHPVGMSDETWTSLLSKAQVFAEDAGATDFSKVSEALPRNLNGERLIYRLNDKSSWPLLIRCVTKVWRLQIQEKDYQDVITATGAFLTPRPDSAHFLTAIPAAYPEFRTTLVTIHREALAGKKATEEAEAASSQQAREAADRVPGTLTIHATEGNWSVFVDGRNVGNINSETSELRVGDLPKGSHKVSATSGGKFLPFTQDVEITSPGQQRELVLASPPTALVRWRNSWSRRGTFRSGATLAGSGRFKLASRTGTPVEGTWTVTGEIKDGFGQRREAATLRVQYGGQEGEISYEGVTGPSNQQMKTLGIIEFGFSAEPCDVVINQLDYPN